MSVTREKRENLFFFFFQGGQTFFLCVCVLQPFFDFHLFLSPPFSLAMSLSLLSLARSFYSEKKMK